MEREVGSGWARRTRGGKVMECLKKAVEMIQLSGVEEEGRRT